VLISAENQKTTTTDVRATGRSREGMVREAPIRRDHRLYSPRQVAEQQGTFSGDYTVARQAAEAFYTRLRELFNSANR
jgi:isocitrate lyase